MIRLYSGKKKWSQEKSMAASLKKKVKGSGKDRSSGQSQALPTLIFKQSHSNSEKSSDSKYSVDIKDVVIPWICKWQRQEKRKDLKIDIVCLNVFLNKLNFLHSSWCENVILSLYIHDSPWKSCGVKSLARSKDTWLQNMMTATDGTGDAEQWNK